MLGGFLVSLLLARLLPLEDYGAYQVAIAYVGVLASVIGFGQGQIVERETARHPEGAAQRQSARRYVALAAKITIGLFLVFLLVFFAWLRGKGAFGHMLFLLAFLSLPLKAMGEILNAAQRGARRVVIGSANPLYQTLSLALVLAILLAVGYTGLTALAAVSLYTFSTLLALLVTGVNFVRFFKRGPAQAGEPSLQPAGASLRENLAAGLPLMAVSVLIAVNNQADIIMLGHLRAANEAGAYQAATRVANFLTLGLAVLIVPMRPRIARLHAEDDRTQMQELVRRNVRLATAVTLPLAIILALFSTPILASIFGAGFAIAAPALAILAIAQLVAVISGPVQAILVMVGQERIAMAGVFLSTVTNVVLNFALIPAYGLTGAATATAISIVVWNLLLIFAVVRWVRINPTAF